MIINQVKQKLYLVGYLLTQCSCLFVFDTTAPSGTEPPHSRGFSNTVNVLNTPYLKRGARNDFLRLENTLFTALRGSPGGTGDITTQRIIFDTCIFGPRIITKHFIL